MMCACVLVRVGARGDDACVQQRKGWGWLFGFRFPRSLLAAEQKCYAIFYYHIFLLVSYTFECVQDTHRV